MASSKTGGRQFTRFEDVFTKVLGTGPAVVRKSQDQGPGSKPDLVNAPAHYTRLNPQPIEVIEAWGLDFSMGSALKYIARAGFKAGEDAATDLRKAVSFIQRRIARLEKTK